ANVAADYEAAKEYSTGAGSTGAKGATTSQRGSSQPGKASSVAASTGNPEDYLDMAQDINQTSAAAKDK
ncbi:MAG: hypothetical protein HC866_26820, partial [Leptolyngbyaceae cyanobacterium RU_5_1]|nr:hypothetical protein [Leptolyngbyaceae cyanobacterium RU_5_1]